MRIDILHVADCPNLAVARSRVAEALDQAGLSATIRETEVRTPDEAFRVGLHGSPTILVEGRDPFGGVEGSLACRLYREGGTVEGSPTVAALVKVLCR